MLVLISYKYRLLSQIHKILSSTNLNNILSSSNPHIFVFLIFTFVNICQNLSFESLLSKVSLVISDYFHKTTNQLWIENLKMTGLKGCKKYQEK